MKCLEKDRNRRYETANGLALDVQRYLVDEPVLASPPSPLYRLRKFARRHTTALGTTTAATLVLVLAVVGIGWVVGDRAAQDTIRRADLAGRRAQTERTVTPALAKAELLAGQAEARPAATSKAAADELVVWGQAEAAVAEAEAALRTGVAEEPLRQRIVEVRQRLEQGREKAQWRQTQANRKEKLLQDLDEAPLCEQLRLGR